MKLNQKTSRTCIQSQRCHGKKMALDFALSVIFICIYSTLLQFKILNDLDISCLFEKLIQLIK